jgi:hypothetical protein
VGDRRENCAARPAVIQFDLHEDSTFEEMCAAWEVSGWGKNSFRFALDYIGDTIESDCASRAFETPILSKTEVPALRATAGADELTICSCCAQP